MHLDASHGENILKGAMAISQHCHFDILLLWGIPGVTVGYADKPVIQILQLCFPPPFSFSPYLVGTTQCCSVHSQPTPVAICYVLRANHPLVSNCTLFPYHSFKIYLCLQTSRQALLSHVALVIELPCATKGTGEWRKGGSAGRGW